MTFQDKFSKYEINNYGVRLPKIEISSSDAQKYGVTVDTSAKDFLRVLCKHGYEEKIKSGILDKSKYETYVERTKYELKIFDETNFTDYMILVWDIVNFCRTNDIPLGVGRGSAAGSFVLFLLGVTEVDPIRYGLFFERFVSKTRAKAQVIDGVTYIDGSLAPDIDLDICHDNRHRVVEYLYGKYPNRCCKLSTLSTLQSKILIKECGKIVGDMSEDDVKLVSDTIPTEFGRVYGLDEAYEHSEDFRNFCNSNKKVYRVARKLAKLVKNKSSHASGYLISFDPLTESIPLETSNSGDIVSSFDMRDAQKICIKVDLLGLHDVTLISNICKRVGIVRSNIDIDDPFIYKKLSDLETPYGLFQISGDCNLRVLRDVKPRNLTELSSVIALGRPGALAYVDDFANYVRTGEFQSVHPFFDDILRTTGGLPLFQEQMMAMSNKIGLTLDESEQLRRCVSKKLNEMEEWETIVRNQVDENKLDPKVADVLWKVLDDSKKYSFNLSHSICYATLSALGSYLKFKYPKEFFLEVLRMAQNKSDTLGEISIIDKEIKHFGIRMMPPDLVKSQLEFIIDGDCIRFGLSAIKGISEKSFEKLKSFISTDTSNKFEVFQAAKNAKLNIGITSSLIQAGTLSSMGENRPLLVLEAQAWNLLTPRERLYCLAHGEQYGYRLLHAIKDMLLWKNEKGKSFVKLSRFESFKEKFTPFKKIYELNSANPKFASYIYEKQLLGFSFSSTLKDLFDGRTENRLMNTYEANHSDENQYIDIVAEVREVFSSISKAKKKYCKMVIEDELGTAQVMMFDPSWSQYKDNAGVPSENDIVYIKGKVWKDNIIIANAMTVQNDKIFMKLSELKNHNEKDER